MTIQGKGAITWGWGLKSDILHWFTIQLNSPGLCYGKFRGFLSFYGKVSHKFPIPWAQIR